MENTSSLTGVWKYCVPCFETKQSDMEKCSNTETCGLMDTGPSQYFHSFNVEALALFVQINITVFWQRVHSINALWNNVFLVFLSVPLSYYHPLVHMFFIFTCMHLADTCHRRDTNGSFLIREILLRNICLGRLIRLFLNGHRNSCVQNTYIPQ